MKRLPAFVVAAAVLLAGCSTSGYRYVTNSKTKTYFKIPGQWRLFDENEIFASQFQGLSPETEAATKEALWMVAFDADPRPSLNHLFQSTAGYPQGFAWVFPLSQSARDSLSLATIRNMFFHVDQLAAADPESVEILQQQDLVLDSGFHGSRYVINIRPPEQDRYITVNQTGLVDPATKTLYLFVVGCEAHCYLAHKKTIDQIVDSWTVKER
jgi:hypothetical protein